MYHYYILIATFFIIIIGFFASRSLFYMKKRERMIVQFPEYSALLQFHMEKAYDMIYKDQVLTYSIEASRLPDKEYDVSVREFIRLVEKMLGKGLCKEYTFLYGDYNTFVFNLAEYFISRYDSDEIRETAMENVMETEVDETEGS